MGVFSFVCKESGLPIATGIKARNSSPVYLFLLKDGIVVETMYGNYDGYGAVFNHSWNMSHDDICSLMELPDTGNGIAAIHSEFYDQTSLPTTRSEPDPQQGQEPILLAEFLVKNSYHKVLTAIPTTIEPTPEADVRLPKGLCEGGVDLSIWNDIDCTAITRMFDDLLSKGYHPTAIFTALSSDLSHAYASHSVATRLKGIK